MQSSAFSLRDINKGSAPVASPDATVTELLRELNAATGVSLVSDNLEAFAMRALSARAARRSLDLQYYTWGGDFTGRLLAREVLRAADRGVRVRLLLDDLYVIGSDRTVGALAAHPSIEIRLFNAFRWRAWSKLSAALEFVIGGMRLNHRMHNKAWIADDRLVIGGGRNIGDEYFDAASGNNFRDLDLLIVGQAVTEARAEFDSYWTSESVTPIESFATACPVAGDLPRLRQTLENAVTSADAEPYLRRLSASPALATLLAGKPKLLAADGVHIAADQPDKARGGRGEDLSQPILNALAGAKREVLLISPYFVPGKRGLAALTQLARRGIKVGVLTNSLNATDVTAVHSGYARYRKRLLRAGIDLFELKRTGREERGTFGSSGASLHTKAFVVDDGLIFVGSFNLDPRSATLNTEMGAFARHPVLARQLRAEYDRLTAPGRSYAVHLKDDNLLWSDRVGGQPRVLRSEPDASFPRRVMAGVIRFLPIESQL